MSSETYLEAKLGQGALVKGRWYCKCGLAAVCRTTKKSSPNKGRKFWRCSRSGDEQCTFFLWMQHEAEVQEQLKSAQPPPFPQTPIQRGASSNKPDQPAVSAGGDQYTSSQISETPFTKAKGKGMLRGIPDHDDSGDYSNHNLNGNKDSLEFTFATDDPFTHSSQLPEYARKAARTSLFATPGRSFTERQENRTASLSTPNSRDRMAPINRMTSQLQLLQPADTSPTPGRFYDRTSLYGNGESDLATAILELIRSDNLKLKASTEVQVRHKVGLALDVGETKLRRYEETISELRRGLEELETTVSQSTA